MVKATKDVKMWRFYTADIMDATGYERAKVRRDIRGGNLDPSDLVSLSLYVASSIARRVASGECVIGDKKP